MTQRLLWAGRLALAAFWWLSVGVKLAHPDGAYDLMGRLVGYGSAAVVLFGLVCGAEAGVGLALLERRRSPFVGLLSSAALLLVFSVVLFHLRGTLGATSSCGCTLRAFGDSIESSLVRNAILGCEIAVLCGLALCSRRRD